MPVGYSFEDLKDFTGLDIHTKPPDGRAADFHFIYLAGDEVIAKRQEASTVVVTKFAYSILYKYRQLKDIVHGQLGELTSYNICFLILNNILFRS